MFIVWDGEVMVTEVTEFSEPLMKYSKGTAFNIYQIMMKKLLPFNYRAIHPDEYIYKHRILVMRDLYAERKKQIMFNEHLFKPYDYP